MAAEFLPGNRLTLLNSGDDYFPALLAAIDSANLEIYLESYIFADDEIGHEVAGALCRAAQRGVQVSVTVDGFGASNFAADFLPRLTEAGVRALFYRPEIGRFHIKRHRLRRLHRKLAVIDHRIAFVGGINIVDDNNAPEDMRPRFDYAVSIEGPTLQQVHHAVRHMWEIVSWASLKRRFRLSPVSSPQCQAVGTQSAAFLIRDNIRHRNDILHAYVEAIDNAKDEILIANAYFLPGVRFGRALYAAAKRGVRITVLLQGKTDHQLLRYATQTLYATALETGIRIFEYEKSFMHAKVAVIDSAWATVGSSNIDPFSLLLNKEANIVVRDPRFGGELRDSLLNAIEHGARELQPEELSRQPWHSRLLRWLAYGVVRAMVGIAGYGQHHWQNQDTKPEQQ
ncbi:cardiolipin synthase ClsB [Ferribacterium limneticum]|uniref:cardiolipin synthase ClsB n=1 Tax=Ferribacterium limneticum TaxID=76259 RepID=UPI001CFA365F|nr:cardiolipin synthase ClsB [Ferribacterium limneticum]UCV28127.1 cardiolipin synthase ClsB [Ferribacterium limneticum]UCV32044.1 cardiolipin synthase ClsB [Ferribacterium limneticum]